MTRRAALLFSILLIMTLIKPASAQEDITKVRAVFLFKFADYVTWPANKPKTPFGFCLNNRHAVGDALDYLVAKIPDKMVIYDGVEKWSKGDIQKKCHVLFVAQGYQNVIAFGVLTVSNQKGFASKGVIEMVDDPSKRIKLRINPSHATAQHLKISSNLLRLAEIVP